MVTCWWRGTASLPCLTGAILCQHPGELLEVCSLAAGARPTSALTVTYPESQVMREGSRVEILEYGVLEVRQLESWKRPTRDTSGQRLPRCHVSSRRRRDSSEAA